MCPSETILNSSASYFGSVNVHLASVVKAVIRANHQNSEADIWYVSGECTGHTLVSVIGTCYL